MRTPTDIAKFLETAGMRFQDLGDGFFVVALNGANADRRLAIKVQDDVVVFQLRALDAPEPGSKGREELLERLLRLNGQGLLHSAFSMQDDGIYLQAALSLQNLDGNEIQAVLDDIGLAVSQHVSNLQQAAGA